ncbi:hypothetical protein M405DRAFT_835705 [Rhizopogon salebrosus TDB-379]|nr:hypothetical protein M405DRAFT_835705 [Rhizopogon salebrosus TDB-379]
MNGNSGDRREQLEGNGGTVRRDKRPGRCADARPESAKWDMRDQGKERSFSPLLFPFFGTIVFALEAAALLAARLFWTFRGDLRTWGSSSSSDSPAVSGLSDTTAFAFLLRGAGVAAVGSREGVSGGGGGALRGGHDIGIWDSEGVSGRGKGALREGTILWG